jgi:hypothetical protein
MKSFLEIGLSLGEFKFILRRNPMMMMRYLTIVFTGYTISHFQRHMKRFITFMRISLVYQRKLLRRSLVSPWRCCKCHYSLMFQHLGNHTDPATGARLFKPGQAIPGAPDGDARLRRIARAGKQWKRTVGRTLDQEGEWLIFLRRYYHC